MLVVVETEAVGKLLFEGSQAVGLILFLRSVWNKPSPLPTGHHLFFDSLHKLFVTAGALERPLPSPGTSVLTHQGHLVKVVDSLGLLTFLLVEDGIVVTVLVDSHLLQMDGGAHVLQAARADVVPSVDGGGRSTVDDIIVFGMAFQYAPEGLDGLDDVALTGGRIVVGGPQLVDLFFGQVVGAGYDPNGGAGGEKDGISHGRSGTLPTTKGGRIGR